MRTLLILALLAPTVVLGQEVNLETFVRAETDHQFRTNLIAMDVGVGELFHLREPTTPDNQPVIRMNQDTFYSSAILDLSEPVEITLPDADGRYMSLQVVNQDHYMFVESGPGTYRLTQEEVGTRFASISIRTFADVTDPQDIERAHEAQDAIEMKGGGDGPFEAPDWDTERLAIMRKAFNDVAALGFSAQYAFGREDEVRPVDYIVGAAAGWGGLPSTAAMYVMDAVAANDGTTPHAVSVADVPVDAFWSITVYNADGYLEANDLGRNSYNDVSAEANPDGSFTIHFGGCDDGRVNCLPITPGWNYAIRMYEPRQEILDGDWTFPPIEPVGGERITHR